ncbi:unnamed protein product [Orchesella dallaii]|uniref:Uncharacterized protein n=1 Tax=Orchesella dallaii TaxID=48710 RepID=A0ABP1PN44_9HEXA
MLGVSVQDAFHRFEKSVSEYEPYRLMADGSTRLGMIFDTSTIEYYKAHTSEFLHKNFSSNFICFEVDQTFHNNQYYWEIRTENQYWLKGTIQRLIASGLYRKWNEWSIWHKILADKLLTHVHSLGPDIVDVYKILAILLIWTCSCVLAAVIFCVEINLCGNFYLFTTHSSNKHFIVDVHNPEVMRIKVRENLEP